MPTVQIPLDGGLITQVAPEKVGLSGCTELIDCEFDKPGLIYKRIGRGAVTPINAQVGTLIRWIAYDGTVYWIVFDSVDGKVYKTITLGTLGSEIFDSSATAINILNYGTMLRFANGTGYQPKLHQYIDRDFFWGGYDFTPAFNTDWSIPQPIDYTLTYAGKLSTDYESSMGHTTKNYQYKVTFVYDGNQETELPKLSAVNSKMLLNASTQVSADNHVFFFALLFTEVDWNPRCTGINIYRREGSGVFYKVSSVSTLVNDENLQLADGNAFVTKVMTESSSGLTTAINAKELYVNGFAHTIATQQNAQFASMTDALNGSLTNQWGTTGCNELRTPSNITNTTATAGAWFVGEAIVNGTSGIYMEDGFTTDWTTDTHGSVTVDTSVKKYGASSLRIEQASAGIAGAGKYIVFGAGYTSTDSFTVGFWMKSDNVSGGSACTVSINMYMDGTGEYQIFASTNTDIDDWVYCQRDVLLSAIPGYTNGSTIRFEVAISDYQGSGTRKVWIDNLVVAEKVYNTNTGKLGFGDDVVASESFDLGAEDSAIGWGSQVGGNTAGIQAIKNNYQYAYKNSGGGLSASTTQTVNVCRSYLWKKVSSTYSVFYRDLDDTNGIVHPTGETSLDVNFTYSVNLDGRQYVAGIALNPSDENEIHKDWVLFSELSQPDVIPISNYIAIPDLQGGEITGLAKLIGDLVVFQTKGIYRLSTPSADPFGWSLSESEPNIGCIAPDSIVEHDAGVFFAGSDHIYHLGSNFQAIPVTQTIKDVYQGTANLDQTTLTVDVKKNRLLCKFGDTDTTVYTLDLTKIKQGTEHWSKMDLSSGRSVSLFVVDEDLKVYTLSPNATPVTDVITHALQSDPCVVTALSHPFIAGDLVSISGVVGMTELNGNTYSITVTSANAFTLQNIAGSADIDAEGFTEYVSGGVATTEGSRMSVIDAGSSEPTALKRTTGWIPMGDLDSSGVLRRLNMRYKSTDAITVKIYTDGDAGSVVKTITIPADTSGADWYKCKPNVRCRNFMIEVTSPSSVNAVEIRRMEVEIG